MYRTVVKFDPLTDTNGAGAQHNHLAPAGHLHLVLLPPEGGIVVRRSCFKLSGAGIDHLIAGHNAHALARCADFVHGLAGDFRNGHIGQAHGLSCLHQAGRQRLLRQLVFYIGDIFELIYKPLVNFGDGVNFLNRGCTAAQSLGHDENAFIVDAVEIFLDTRVIPGIHLRHVQAVDTDFQGAQSL